MTNNSHASWVGSNAPTNEEARVQPGFRTNQTTNAADCADRRLIGQGPADTCPQHDCAAVRDYMEKAGYPLVKANGEHGPWTILAKPKRRDEQVEKVDCDCGVHRWCEGDK